MTIVTDVHNRSARDRESRGRALQRLLHLGIVVRRLGEVQVGAADPERRVDNHVPRAEIKIMRCGCSKSPLELR